MFRSCYAQKDNLQQIFEYKMKNKNAKRNLNTANTPSTANNNPSHIFRKALKLCKIVKKHPRYFKKSEQKTRTFSILAKEANFPYPQDKRNKIRFEK